MQRDGRTRVRVLHEGEAAGDRDHEVRRQVLLADHLLHLRRRKQLLAEQLLVVGHQRRKRGDDFTFRPGPLPGSALRHQLVARHPFAPLGCFVQVLPHALDPVTSSSAFSSIAMHWSMVSCCGATSANSSCATATALDDSAGQVALILQKSQCEPGTSGASGASVRSTASTQSCAKSSSSAAVYSAWRIGSPPARGCTMTVTTRSTLNLSLKVAQAASP